MTCILVNQTAFFTLCPQIEVDDWLLAWRFSAGENIVGAADVFGEYKKSMYQRYAIRSVAMAFLAPFRAPL